jgi:hypothetical protein
MPARDPFLRPAIRLAALGSALFSFCGCGLYSLDPPASSSGEVEQVVLKIAEVPSDVRCLRINIAGPGRTVEREIETAGEASLTQNLSGLPLGTVTFLGEAFTAACTSVTKSSVAAWTSQPVETSIVLGRLSTVELIMTRNGRAKVQVTFNEEGACTAVGQACRIPSECCSKKCTAQVCAPPEEETSSSSVPKVFP